MVDEFDVKPAVNFRLVASGYTVKETDIPLTSFAKNDKTGDAFFYDVRIKQSPSYRRITGDWEFGVDIPDYILSEQTKGEKEIV